MLVNVAITNYNNQDYIVEALQSVINQVCSEQIHACLIDDNSTDNSISNLESAFNVKINKDEWCEFEVNNVRVSIFARSTNAGPSVGRNMCIDHCSNSDYVGILDGDDKYTSDKIEKFISVFKRYPEVALVYSDYFILNTETQLSTTEFKRSYSREKLLRECIVHSAAFIRTSALTAVKDEYGIFDPRMKGPEDYDLWLRLAEKFMVYHVADITSIVRHTGKNISNTKKEENQKNYEYAFSLIREKMEQRHARVSTV